MLTRTIDNRPRRRRTGWSLGLVAAFSMFTIAPLASGQYELGRGDALDRNPGVGTGGHNRPAQQEDFRARNLVVTGNVPGGRGFRGSVGYTAEGDFRESIGADDLFQFRADSAFSSPEAVRTGRATERFRFGYDLSEFEVRRAGAGATPATMADRWTPGSDFVDTQRRLDRMSQELISGTLLERRFEPARLGVVYEPFEDADGESHMMPYIAAVTPLRGLEMQRWDRDFGRLGLTSYDMLRMEEDFRAGRGLPTFTSEFEGRFEAMRLPDSRVGGFGTDEEFEQELESRRTPSGRVEAELPGTSQYDRILETLADRYATRFDRDAEDEQTLRELDQHFSTLRRSLVRPFDEEDEFDLREEEDEQWQRDLDRREQFEDDRQLDPTERMQDRREGRFDPERGRTPERLDPHEMRPGGPAEHQEGDALGLTREDLTPRHFDPTDPDADDPADPFGHLERMGDEEIGVVLRHGLELDSLRTPESEDRFNELMGSAEEMLRTGEYFRAERRFHRALRFSADHPLATAGGAHSQIGAGLHAAAAANVRHLLTNHPEMIDTRYEAGLLPEHDRLYDAVETIRDRMERTPRVQAQQSLLMAYLGHHLADPDIVEEGLNMMPAEDPLRELLRSVWIEDAQVDDPADEDDGDLLPRDGDGSGSGVGAPDK